MSRIWRKGLVVLVASVCLTLAVQPAQAQFAVVTVKSIDDVFDAAKVLAEKAGEGDKAKQLGALKLFISGVDLTKPLGIYVGVPTDAGTQPPVIGFVPVTKEDDLLDQLKQFQVEIGKPEKEIRTVAGPNGQNGFLRFANGYAYVSDRSESLEGKLPDPAKFLPAASKTHLIAASLRMSQLPKKMRQEAIEEMKKNIDKDKERKDGETDAAYEGRLFGMKLAQEAVTSFMLEGEDVSLGLKVDAKADKLIIDLATTAAPGTGLADSYKKLGSMRSKFAPLAADSAFNFICALPLSQELRTTFGKVVAKGVKEEIEKEKDPAARKLAERAFEAMRDSFNTDVFDFGLFLTGPYADKLVGFVGGVQVKEGKKLDVLFRAAAQDPKQKDGEIKLDVDKVGGIAIHRIVPKDTDKVDEKALKAFGNKEVFVCFRDDVVLFSLGKHGLSALKDTMGRLDRATPAKDTDPVQMEFSFLKIAQMDENSFKAGEAEAIRKALAGSPKGSDRMRFSLLGGDSLRVRFDMSLELIKAFAAVGKARGDQ